MKSALMMLSAVTLGLVSGAMLLVGGALVPYWATLAPDEYRHVFGAMWLGTVMLPLGVAAIVVTIAALISVARERSTRRRWMLLALVLWLAPVVIYPFVNEPLNLQIAGNAPLRPEEVRAMLHHWRFLHWVRTALGIAAFICALRAVASGPPSAAA